MSFNRLSAALAKEPKGPKVASFPTQEQALAAIDHLSEKGYPINRVSIVGSDLKMIEHVQGRMSFGRSLFAGIAQGLWLGLMMGLVFMLISENATWNTVGTAAGIGLLSGIVLGVVAHFLRPGGSNQLVTRSQIIAGAYDVHVTEDVEQVRQLLAPLPGNTFRAQTARPRADDPAQREPRYGVRLDPERKQKLLETKAAENSPTLPNVTNEHGEEVPFNRDKPFSRRARRRQLQEEAEHSGRAKTAADAPESDATGAESAPAEGEQRTE